MTSDGSPEAGSQPAARALASRRNGAWSRGPRTAAGLARSSRNALKHGLRARRHVLLADEDSAEYRAFQAAAQVELAPVSALQTELATRIVTTAWRARRADRLEAAVLGRFLDADALPAGDAQEALGPGLMRDGYGPRELETLVRYRSSVLAELFRALAALGALRAQARAIPHSAPALLEPAGANDRTNPRSCAETGT
jgi:hypothetical protein